MIDHEVDLEELGDSSLSSELDLEDLSDSLHSAELDLEDLRESSLSQAEVDNAASDAVDQDNLVMTLPDIPCDSDSHPSEEKDILAPDIDEQIQQRLTRLKFFTQAWSSKDSSCLNSSIIPEAETEALKADEDEAVEVVPVESTEEDRQQFNSWYYAQVDNPHKHHIASPSKYLPLSDIPSSLSTPSHLPHPMNMDTSYMTSTSEQQMVAMAVTSHTSDPTRAPSGFVKFETSKQQDLLNVMNILCYVQVYMVTMILTVSIILDKLNSEISMCSSQPYSFTKSSDPPLMDTHSQPAKQVPCQELVQGGVQEVQVSSLGSSDNEYVPPWRRIGNRYTKLHSSQMF